MTLWVFLGFLAAFMAFVVWLVRGARKAGGDALAQKQGKVAERNRADARDAEGSVDSMSDSDVRGRLRDKWTRPK